ncbi:hypothetical protein SDC9_59305 [bioreactor metagenome]|uniref:Prolow-density lipoprotein receptor-related protein 1-like beta-propeller domain-containing protein n=1 Tax=bioreactor metagenome TaxID=1076179 RepID=A0A644X9V8_9ZZZZ
MNRKWVVLLALALSLFAGCAVFPNKEPQPPVDGQAKEEAVIKGSDFAVDEDGSIFYSKRGDPGEMVRRDSKGNETYVTEWGGPIILSGDWLYCRSVDDKFYKIKTDGSEKELIRSEYTNGSMIMIGDWIYLRCDDNSISRMDTNGESLQKVSDHNYNVFVGYIDNWLYYIRYNYEHDKNKETKTTSTLYKMRADGSEVTLIADYNTVDICIDGDSIYYLIEMDEYQRDIYRSDLDGGNLTQLHILPQDDNGPYRMAVKDGWIYYYIWYNGSELHRVRVDGTGDEVIFESLILKVELSGDWLFCYDDITGYWWKVSFDGTEKEQLYPDTFGYQGPGI